MQFIAREWGSLPDLLESAPLPELRVFSVSFKLFGKQVAVDPRLELEFLENGAFSTLYRRGVFEWKEVALGGFTDVYTIDTI